MTLGQIYQDKWNRFKRNSEFIRKHFPAQMSYTDFDQIFCQANVASGRYAIFEFKSHSLIMSPSQFETFNFLETCWSQLPAFDGIYAIIYAAQFIDEADSENGFSVYQAPFIIVRQLSGGNLKATSSRRRSNCSLDYIKLFGKFGWNL
jgi:hypothetical protein